MGAGAGNEAPAGERAATRPRAAAAQEAELDDDIPF
jgi:hypothetical protein